MRPARRAYGLLVGLEVQPTGCGREDDEGQTDGQRDSKANAGRQWTPRDGILRTLEAGVGYGVVLDHEAADDVIAHWRFCVRDVRYRWF